MKTTTRFFSRIIVLIALVPMATFAGKTTADGVNDFGDCNDDAKKLGCYEEAKANASSSSWKIAFVNCLNSHESELSSACKASLSRRADANKAMVSACKTDTAQYCKGVEPAPGKEPLVDCLKSHESELSSACAEALAAQQAMKSTN